MTLCGTLLLEARARAGLKQEVVGLMIGCTGSYINRLEKNRTLPSFEAALKLEQALHLHRGRVIQVVIETKVHQMLDKAKALGVTLSFSSSRLLSLEPNGHSRSQKNVAQV